VEQRGYVGHLGSTCALLGPLGLYPHLMAVPQVRIVTARHTLSTPLELFAIWVLQDPELTATGSAIPGSGPHLHDCTLSLIRCSGRRTGLLWTTAPSKRFLERFLLVNVIMSSPRPFPPMEFSSEVTSLLPRISSRRIRECHGALLRGQGRSA
jgi:hypothetical protein